MFCFRSVLSDAGPECRNRHEFDQYADLLEIEGENQFRVRAFRRAERTIEGLQQSVRSMLVAEQDLSELSGIGKDLAAKIASIVKSGHFELLDKLKKKLPGDLGAMAAAGPGPEARQAALHQSQSAPARRPAACDQNGQAARPAWLRAVDGKKDCRGASGSEAIQIGGGEAEVDALVAFLRDTAKRPPRHRR